MKEHNSVFVKLNEYKEILDVISLIRGKLKEAKDTINELHELKGKEDGEIRKWEQNFADLEKKIGDIDSLMAKPEM